MASFARIRWVLAVGGMWLAMESAAWPAEWSDARRDLAIVHQGRVMSFETFAKETLEFIMGPAWLRVDDPVQMAWSIIADSDQWSDRPLIWIPPRSLRAQLGMDESGAFASFRDLTDTPILEQLVSAIHEKQRQGARVTSLERDTLDVSRRVQRLRALFEQELHLVPPPEHGGVAWLPILQPEGYPIEQQIALKRAWASLETAIKQTDGPSMVFEAHRLLALLHNLNPAVYPVRGRASDNAVGMMQNAWYPSHLFMRSRSWDAW